MDLKWIITDSDVRRVKDFMAEYAGNALVKHRVKRNITNRPTSVDCADFWMGVVACLLTTQQRSGPKSRVTGFLNSDPFPLSFERCRTCDNVVGSAQKILTDHGGIRFAPKIAKQLADNLEWLEDRWWPQVEAVLCRLVTNDDPKEERDAARFIDREFNGFGPKQSRNLLQMLGLTRYEIPFDSRVAKWFNRFGFPIKLSTGSLADEGVYEFLSDGIQQLCKMSDIFPCVLDGAIFASFDDNGHDDAWGGTGTHHLVVQFSFLSFPSPITSSPPPSLPASSPSPRARPPRSGPHPWPILLCAVRRRS